MSNISAVWVYWDNAALSDELKWSIKSVEHNFVDLENAVVCGDSPSWHNGLHINSPVFTARESKRKYGTKRWRKWVDSIIKLQRIIDSPLVTDDFLWLYDDTFFVKPVTAAELAVPRATRLLCDKPGKPSRSKWREVLRRTTVALQDAGLPARNYSHHGPVVYNKQKLQQTIDKFDPLNRPRAIESLYMNHHFTDPKPLAKWMVYTQHPKANWQPHRDAKIVNVGAFAKSVRDVMVERFSVPRRVAS